MKRSIRNLLVGFSILIFSSAGYCLTTPLYNESWTVPANVATKIVTADADNQFVSIVKKEVGDAYLFVIDNVVNTSAEVAVGAGYLMTGKGALRIFSIDDRIPNKDVWIISTATSEFAVFRGR